MADSPTVPIAKPSFGEEEERAVLDVLRSGWVSQGPRVEKFENKLRDYLGCGYVRAVNSGTSAILLALKAIGTGPGDSVVVPAFTCAATALPAVALGAEVLFADVGIPALNLEWPTVERALRPNTKAVVLVHLFGRMADASGFAVSCSERGIHLIEDACLALGAKRNGKSAGTHGTAGCYSFHPRKLITTGEGGAVCTDDEAVAESVERDRNYGAVASAWSRFKENVGRLQGFRNLAFNFKLTDLQAAIGIVQLDRLPGFLEERKNIGAHYAKALADVPGLIVPTVTSSVGDNVHQAFVCLWAPHSIRTLADNPDALERAVSSLKLLRSGLASKGIATTDAAQFLPELPVFGVYSDEQRHLGEEFPAAFLAARLAFALPIFPGMTPKDIDRVVDAVRTGAESAA